MIKSIKYFLLISLLLSITVAAVINGVGNYLLDEQVIQPYLDSQLIRISTLIGIVYKSISTNTSAQTEIVAYLHNLQLPSKQQFFFQIWNKEGALLLHSSTPNCLSLKNAKIGFSDEVLQGNGKD